MTDIDLTDLAVGPTVCETGEFHPVHSRACPRHRVAFLRSPDGIVFEFVERLLRHFTR